MKQTAIASLILISIILLGFSCKSKKNMVNLIPVHFSFAQTSDYCGGAAPPDDLIAELETPKPMEPRTIVLAAKATHGKGEEVEYFRYEISNPDTVLSVPLGKQYVFVHFGEFWRLIDADKKLYDCMYSWATRPAYEIDITPETKNVKVRVHLTCNPCIEPAP